MLDLTRDLKGLLTIGLTMMGILSCPLVSAEPIKKVPSAVLRPFVATANANSGTTSTQPPASSALPNLVKPVDIVPALPVVKEVYTIQPIVSKTPVTDSLKKEAPKVEVASHPTELNHVNAKLNEIVNGLLGVKYKFGANNPDVALDCSALILRIMEAAGKKNLPRTAHMLAASSKPVESHELKVGDLLFFNTRGRNFSHVGMYMGDGHFVHASQQKGKVTFSKLSAAYFAKRFTGARRVIY